MVHTMQDRVLSALESGSTLTAAQVRARFGVANVSALINNLRNQGYAIYSNPAKKTSRTGSRTYRLGTPSAAFTSRCAVRGIQVR